MTRSSSASGALQHKLWHGRIPVVFSLHPSDVTTLHAPRPFYAMLPRMGYLISQTRTVIEYFRDAAPPIAGLPGQSIWFAHNGQPLKWHLPCGVLFDLSQARENPHHRHRPEQPPLPWRITVHFSGSPADEVLPCENEQVVESHFMHSLKQSMFLRAGSTKLIMSMPEAQQAQIWSSIVQNDLGSFYTATRDLQLATPSMRFVPLRVYVENDPVVIQLPVSPTLETLGHALAMLLPDLFLSPTTTPTKHDVITHGVAVPMTVPLLALYEQFAYPDGFLHVAVVSTA